MKKAAAVHFINTPARTVILADQQAKIVGTKCYGGKIEAGETPVECLVREVPQETGGVKEYRLNPEEEGGIVFSPNDLVPVAKVDFYNGPEELVPFGSPSFSVIFFNCYIYSGRAIDTLEMRNPKEYAINDLPVTMVPGDELFLRPILEGNLTKGWVRRTADFKTVLGSHFEPAVIEDLVI